MPPPHCPVKSQAQSNNVLKFHSLTVVPNESFLFVNWLFWGFHCSCKTITLEMAGSCWGHRPFGRWPQEMGLHQGSFGSVLGPHWEVPALSSRRHSRSWLIIWVCRWHPSDRAQQWGLWDQRHKKAEFLHEDKPTQECHLRLHLESKLNDGFCSKDLGLRSAEAQVCCERFGRAVGVGASQLWGY